MSRKLRLLDLGHQSLQNLLRIFARLLDEPHDALELGHRGIAHELIHDALARRYRDALVPQPRQGDGHLLAVAAAHAVREHVWLVPRRQEVQRGLRDANV